MIDLPKTKAEALAAGVKWFFTGKPCVRGHISKRFASIGTCMACARENSQRKRSEKPELVAEILRRYRTKHRDRFLRGLRDRYAANAEERREYARKYRIENAEKVKVSCKLTKLKRAEIDKVLAAEWRSKNVSYLKKYKKEHYAKNRDAILAANAKWYRENPEHNRANQSLQCAKRIAAEGKHTRKDSELIKKAQNGKCIYCKTQLNNKWHGDHILPLSKGGTNWPSNIQILCPSCNLSKNDTDPIEFAQKIGMLL